MSSTPLFRAWLLSALLALLGGCAGQSAAPVIYPTAPGIATQPQATASAYGSYTVRKGDTLYSIAKRFGQSISNLASWNTLRAPYALRVGQVLQVLPPGSRDAVVAPAPPALPPQEPMRRVYPGTIKRKSAAAFSADCPAPAFAWQWPAQGQTENSLSSTGRVGLEIFGNPGQTIYAAADGQVIYSGPGLNGYYGNLVILKHDEPYLSVYGYARARRVAEGESVKRGQPIAEMGENRDQRAALYFEINCRDKTVEPLWYLPR